MGLTYSSVVDAGVDEVFSWHARPGAITRLVPPWQPVRVIREAGVAPRRPGRARPARRAALGRRPPAGQLRSAARVRRCTGIPPAVRCCRGGTRTSSARRGSTATLVTDVVDSPLPARALRSMFVYRHRQLAGDLAALARARAICPDTLTIAVTGSGGLIGTALTALLTTSGYQVVRLVRQAAQDAGERYWRPEDPAPDLLNGIDAVIHLAGASIGGRFTPERKNEIRASRILPTRLLAELAAATASARGPARVRHGVGHRHLRPRPRRGDPDRGQCPRRGIPGRRGGRLGGSHHPGRRGRHQDGAVIILLWQDVPGALTRMPRHSFLPSGVAPMMTRMHCFSSSIRACRWMPSAHT